MATKRKRAWCYTLNNPTDEEIEHLIKLTGIAKFHVAQIEEGEEKTPHVQGVIGFAAGKTFTAASKTIGKRAHIEVCRNKAASIKYCSKPEGFLRSLALKGKPKQPRTIQKLRPWQAYFDKVITQELKTPNDREVHWIWDSAGNTGKTVFCKYLCIKRGASFLGGKAADAKYAVATAHKEGKLPDQPIFVWNLPRSQENYVSYNSLEAIKDGLFFSGKYEASAVIMDPPVVLVFANFPPDTSKLSADRWSITDIEQWRQDNADGVANDE